MPTPSDRRGLYEQWKLIRRMLGFLAPVKVQVAAVTFIFILYIAVEVQAVRLLRPAVNIVHDLAAPENTNPQLGLWDWLTQAEGPGAALRQALLWLALAKIILSILAWVRAVTTSWQNMSMVYYMRAAVYDRLQRVGFSFHDRHASGALINRALGDLQAVRNFVSVGLHSSVDITFSMIGYFGVFLQTSRTMALTAAVSLPFWIWAIRRFALKARPIYERQMAASDEMVNVLTENVAGVHVVRAFATEEQEKTKFRARCQTLLERILEGVRLHQHMIPVLRGIAVATNVGLFALGATLVQDGTLNIGDLVVLGTAMNIILGKIQQINAIADAYQRAVVSSGRLFEILDSPDTTPQPEGAQPLGPGGGAVHFIHVTFGYEPGKPVLQDVTFQVAADTVVALVGPTGSGKTTLAALLGRFYDPQEGKIRIDGQDLRKRTLKSVRDSVGYVFQETYLFSDTVARNIAYSDLGAPREQIEAAARVAHAEEFILRLPDKYESLIGEYGATLSGGQRQRLALARAVLHNPRILVLDDSLSAVDPETEAHIRKRLERVMAHRTVFLITSRISTARRTDLILVLEAGRITQRGTHEELMQVEGYYREMAASQFAEGGPGQKASHADRMQLAGGPSGRLAAVPDGAEPHEEAL